MIGIYKRSVTLNNKLIVFQLLAGVLKTQTTLMASVKRHGGDVSTVDPVLALCTDILDRLPPLFNMRAVSEKYPIIYTNSMNTVLRQELIRYD